MEFVNTLENGMHKDSSVLLQPSGTYRDMNNGMLVSYDGNDYVVEMPKGTQVSFTLPNNYTWNGGNDAIPTPIGFISFLDVLVVFSTGGATGYGEIGVVSFDEDGIGTYTPLYYHADLNFSTSNQIRGFTYEENDRIKRVYWTDNNNQPRALNINDSFLAPVASGDLVNGQEYMVVGGIIDYNGAEYGPGLDDAGNSLYPNIFTANATTTFTPTTGSPIVYRYIDKVLLDWTPDRENPNIDFKQPITGTLNGGSKSYFVRYKLKSQGITSSWSYGSFPINVYSIGAYSSFNMVEGSGASAVQATTTGIRLTISDINTYYDTIELAVATFDQESNTLTDAYIVTTQPITSSTLDLDHTTEGGEAVTIDDLTLFPATIFKVKDITTNKNYNIIGNIEERSELEDFDGTTATVSDLTYYMPADRIFPNAMNAGLDKQSSTGIASGSILPDGKYVVSGGVVTYSGNNYGPNEPLGPYFTGVTGISAYLIVSGTPVVKACILIKKYKSQAGFDRFKCIELNDDYFDYRGMAATQYLRQYWGEETYRIGLMPYDKKGNPMYVRWIDDFTIQSYNTKGGPMIQRGGNVSLKVNGLSISGITFTPSDIAKMSGFSIVRAPRDKQAMAQGLVFPTYYNPGDAIRQLPLARLKDADTTFCLSNIINWYSPDEMFEYSGFTGGANNYLSGAYYLSYIGNLYEDGFYQKFTKFYNDGEVNNPQELKIDRYNVVNPGGSITDYNGTLDYDNNLTKTDSVNSPFGVAEGVGCRTALLKLVSDIEVAPGVPIGSSEDRLVKPLFNYKILKSNLYGGTSERALANTIYISTGHYQRLDSSVLADAFDSVSGNYIFDEVEVFGGDSFLGIMSLGKSLFDDHYSQSFSYGIFFPVESNCNPYLRQGRNIGQYGMSNNVNDGVYYNISGQSRLEQFLLNDAYATDNSIIAYPALPDVAFSDKFPYRVRWAGPKTLGESVDSFRNFLQNNFRDLDGNKGEINNVRERDGKVFYWQDRAVGYLPILERQMVNGALGEATQLGVVGVIDRFDTLNTYFGNQNTNGLVETEYGFAWFDFRRRAMLAMTVGGGIQEISFVKGLRTFFNNPTLFVPDTDDITQDKPLIGNGICGVYDPMYKMTYLSFKWKNTSTSYRHFTIGYFHPRNVFVGFFNIEPSIWKNHNNFVVGSKSITARTIQVSTDYFVGDKVTKDGIEYTAITDFTTANPVSGEMEPGYVYPNSDPSVYWAKTTQTNEVDLLFSTTNFCKFFGYTYDHYIEVVINPKTGEPFAVDNFIQKSSETNYDNVTFTTDDDTATESTSNNKYYRYYDRGWHGSVPLGAGGRLVDYYLKVKFSITNYTGNPTNSRNLQKVFNFIKSVFRIKK